MNDLRDYAQQLASAAADARAVPQLALHETHDEATSYDVQHLVVQDRIERGASLTGIKLGFTNPAKAAQMGVFDVIAGSITSDMQVADGGTVALTELIHPRIEPELAFLVARDLDLSAPTNIPFTEAVSAVAPALEIIDSRYENFEFSLQDVIADNTSASKYVVGPWLSFDGSLSATTIANLGVTLELDGRVSATGSTAAILGNPVRAYEAACRLARKFGFTIPAGSIILAGAATVALPLSDVSTAAVRITGLGSATVHTTREGS